MNETFEAMRANVVEFCIYAEHLVGNTVSEENVCEMLDRLVTEYGVYDYSFSYLASWLAANYGAQTADILKRIYHAAFDEKYTTPPSITRLRGFAAFFMLATYYISDKQTEEMHMLLDDSEHRCTEIFRDMPLIYDLISRSDKRGTKKNDLDSALFDARRAIRMLESVGVKNVGVSCSFASTVSIMLSKNMRVSADDRALALDAIESAIEYNPNYAKYYFIRARLHYYLTDISKVNGQTLRVLYDARDDCEKAVYLEDLNRRDYISRVGDYQCLRDEISSRIIDLEDELDEARAYVGIDVTEDNILALKQEIIESENEHDLAAFPPANTYGGKYVFICYNRCDYKSVYCDLLELALRHIPFLYDHGTVLAGNDWDATVAERIRDKNCVGVIFYLGWQSVLSAPLSKEIQLLCAKAKSAGEMISSMFFAVNLTGEIPSRIMIDTIRKSDESALYRADFGSEKMVSFLSTFTDAGDFIRRSEDPTSTKHIELIVGAMRRKFGIVPREV